MSHWFVERIASRGDRPAFAGGAGVIAYADLAALIGRWEARLSAEGVDAGEVVLVEGDHAPASFALLVALAARRAIVAPVTGLAPAEVADRAGVAGAAWVIDCRDPDAPAFRRVQPDSAARHPLTERLIGRGHAGLILFSSGSSGEPKACLLDLDRLIEKVRAERRGYVTLAFLLFDHIGGINTLINVLGHGGTVVTVADRTVDAVAAAIEAHGVELLPTSPTFLKMLLIADAAARFDLSSLRLITYGTEVMPEATLTALTRAFPDVTLKQTYGLSEIGIVPTRSRGPGSLWVQIGEGVEHRIVDGILHLRAPTAMLGYLNAPSPFDADGWLVTGDRVEVDGEWLLIKGRDSELINVGGEKVHPAEVENVLLAAGNIRDATVSGRRNPVTGALVVADVILIEPEEPGALRDRLDRFCRARLEPFKVPAAYRIAEAPLHSARFKKIRAKGA